MKRRSTRNLPKILKLSLTKTYVKEGEKVNCPRRKSRRIAGLLKIIDLLQKNKQLVIRNRESTDSGLDNRSDCFDYRDLINTPEDSSPSECSEILVDNFETGNKALTDKILKFTRGFDCTFHIREEEGSEVPSVTRKHTSENTKFSVAEGSVSVPPTPAEDCALTDRYLQPEEEIKRLSERSKLSVAEGVEGTSTSIEVEDYRPSAFDMSIRIREPNIFHGKPEEDGQEWLSRFEILADANKWDTNKITYVKLYLEGTARQWILVRDPRTWEVFKRQFLDAFK